MNVMILFYILFNDSSYRILKFRLLQCPKVKREKNRNHLVANKMPNRQCDFVRKICQEYSERV